MAIYPVAKGVPRYIGLSTDTKPTVAAPQGLEAPLIGSTFLEYDTGSLFITHDATNWVGKDNLYASMEAIVTAQEKLVELIHKLDITNMELGRIRRLNEYILGQEVTESD